MQIEKPKKSENLTAEEIQDWVNWAVAQTKETIRKAEEVDAQEKLALKNAWKRYYAGYGNHPLAKGKLIP